MIILFIEFNFMKMKTLKYLITGIMLIINIPFYSQTPVKNEQVITLKSVTKNVSVRLLAESKAVLLRRLAFMNLQNVQIALNDPKSELVITVRDSINNETLSDILLIRGHLNFYETRNREDVLKYFGKQKSGCIQDAFTFLHLSDSIHRRPESVFGIADAKDTSSINACFSTKEVRGKIPDYVKLLWTVYPGVNNQCELYCISSSDNTFNEQSIKEVHADFKNPELPELCITFKETVWQSWKDATLRNMNKPIALVIDNKVYFAPRIQGEIPHGKISLTGHGLSKAEIRKLVAIISGGTLPLKFAIAGNH